MMSRFLILSLLFIAVFSFSALGQTAQPVPTPPPIVEDTGDVVKITTNLIQIDVVVTDKKGNQVTDLKPEDFEIYENGKKQDISNFSYIFTQSPKESEDIKTQKSKNKYSVPAPSAKLKLEQVKRTYALVIDDLGLSFETVPYVKDSLRKFVNEQVQPGDLVAIIRTGSGIGALQAFTSDKRQMLAAIDKTNWNSRGRGKIGIFDSITTTLKDDINGAKDINGNIKNIQGTEEEKRFERDAEEFRNNNFSIGTLGAVSYVVRAMGELPGRKSLMLFSEGFQMTTNRSLTSSNSRIIDDLRNLTDLANRSSVIIYTFDPRGLQIPSMAFASDDIRDVIPSDPAFSGFYSDSRDLRAAIFRDTQQSLGYLADETGGIPFINQNGLNSGLRKALNDQNGYYLIGYQPNSDTFDPKKNKFNKLTVKLNRDNLKVRYRSGFFRNCR